MGKRPEAAALSRAFELLVLLMLLTVLSTSGAVSANPSAVSVGILILPLLALFLVVTNYPVNLAILLFFAWVSLRTLDSSIFGKRGDQSLVKRVALAAVPISLAGGLIDGYVLFDYSLEITSDIDFWVLAILAIFLTASIFLYTVARTSAGFSLVASLGLAAFNLFAWWIIRSGSDIHNSAGIERIPYLLVLDFVAVASVLVLSFSISRISKRAPGDGMGGTSIASPESIKNASDDTQNDGH